MSGLILFTCSSNISLKRIPLRRDRNIFTELIYKIRNIKSEHKKPKTYLCKIAYIKKQYCAASKTTVSVCFHCLSCISRNPYLPTGIFPHTIHFAWKNSVKQHIENKRVLCVTKPFNLWIPNSLNARCQNPSSQQRKCKSIPPVNKNGKSAWTYTWQTFHHISSEVTLELWYLPISQT